MHVFNNSLACQKYNIKNDILHYNEKTIVRHAVDILLYRTRIFPFQMVDSTIDMSTRQVVIPGSSQKKFCFIAALRMLTNLDIQIHWK